MCGYCTQQVMKHTRNLRIDKKLFVSTISAHNGVNCDTVSRWLKGVLQHIGAGVKKLNVTVPSWQTLQRCELVSKATETTGWSRGCTFKNIYRKPVVNNDNSFRFGQDTVNISTGKAVHIIKTAV